jgi:hypothetical protein
MGQGWLQALKGDYKGLDLCTRLFFICLISSHIL